MFDSQHLGVILGAVIVAALWALNHLGWIKQRTPPQEARAEEMWRSEAIAQKARGDRLERELAVMRDEMTRMRAEIEVLKARPDLSDVIRHFDEHRAMVMARHEHFAEVLGEIAKAVVAHEA